MKYLYSETIDIIIKCFYSVYNKLGHGFLEKVYENSLIIELQKYNLYVIQQKPIKVYYDQIEVGKYYADLFVENSIILELKADESICAAHEAQLINYLKATDIKIGLLLNFGKKPEIRRKIWTYNSENHV